MTQLANENLIKGMVWYLHVPVHLLLKQIRKVLGPVNDAVTPCPLIAYII